MRVACLEDRLAGGGICRAQHLDPPARVLVARLGIGLDARFERIGLSQIGAQQRIDVSLRRPAFQQRAGAHRLIDHGVGGVAAGLERIEGAPQQRLDRRIGKRALRELAHQRLHPPVAPQSAMREIDQRRAWGVAALLRSSGKLLA